jgi:beta-barrel assembly-enhancing protease
MPMEALRVHLLQARCGIAAAMSKGLGTLCLCSCAAFLLWTPFASRAQAAVPAVLSAPVPALPVGKALTAFSNQTGVQVVYLSDLITSQTSHAVPEGLAPTAALTRLLEGTGLGFGYLNERIVRIRATDPHDAPSADPPPLQVVVITADKIPKPPHFSPATAQELRTMALANEELEEHLRHAHLLYGNAALDTYLQGVAERLLATDGTDPAPVHVRVMRGADANAFSLSNGSIYVTTGLLTTLQDESELAAVLGHELTHYTNAHVLRAMREQQHSAALSRAGGVILGVLLAAVAQHYSGQSPTTLPSSLTSIPQTSLEIWHRAMVSGYSRTLEREADDGGIRRMIGAGYDASGALAALQRLSEQEPALGSGEGGLYASHPKMSERMASYREAIAGELAASVPTGRETRRAEYQGQVAALPLDQVAVLIDAGALERAEAQVHAVVVSADSSRAEFLEGEIARARIPQTDATRLSALAAYDRAVALPDPPAAAYRQAGLLHQLRGEPAAAALAFEGYLERAPQAADAPLVRRYLEAFAQPAKPTGSEK